MNIGEIETELSDLVGQPFDRGEFPLALLSIYHAPKATLTKLRGGKHNKGELPGDVLWARKLFFRPVDTGAVVAALDNLKASKAAAAHKPRFLLVCDGHEVAGYDTKADESLHCDFTKLNDRFDFFMPLAGIEKYEAVAENPADIKAAGRLAKLHDEIERCNPDWTTPDKRHALNQFLTRILFCMFAEDTGSFPPELFVKTISEFGGDDGEHLQELLARLFNVMNTPDTQREGLAAHLCKFPYVNGGLFADRTPVPIFNRRSKRLLVEAAQLDWREINPDIFGSMIQAVVDTDMRGDLGMHYTSVPNIMKVLQPLFLMSLEEELAAAHGHREERSRLSKLLNRMAKIKVFDPACGSGNFLIIAYRELRTLEMRVFQRLEELAGGQRARHWSGVKLSNFYGIELADFAAETAKLSLWIAEYQMNQRFKDLFGEVAPNFPLKEGGHIVCGNALRLDWTRVCPPAFKDVQKQIGSSNAKDALTAEAVRAEEFEIFIVGNPPYSGFNAQTPLQAEDLRYALGDARDLKYADYITAWFVKASHVLSYCKAAAFVTTNSICQGLQATVLWPRILNSGVEIAFAHPSFPWKNNAAKNAAVICSIVALRKISDGPKYIFSGATKHIATNINPYLVDAPNILIERRQSPLSSLPKMNTGNLPYDGGNLILDENEKDELLAEHPEAKRLIRRLVGSHEFINGANRFCLWIRDDDIDFALNIRQVRRRVEAVRQSRKEAGKIAQNYAHVPHRFYMTNEAREHQLIVPSVSSVRRPFIPMGILGAEYVVSNLASVIFDAEFWVLSILSSSLHMAWVRSISGRLKNDYRYSPIICYNTFPVPELNSAEKSTLSEHAWSIIAARDAHPGKTIAWLYDPDTMPPNLIEAHKTLDERLDKIYVGRMFKNDTERLQHLLKRYVDMTASQKEAAHA